MIKIFNVFVALLTLVLGLPFLAIVAVFVYFSVGRPILFTQTRSGLNGKLFQIYKFRTMTNEVDTNGNLLPNSERVTTIGNFLRKSSLDELPSLINIIKGEMSLVGPRPLLPEYFNCYTEKHKKRLQVLPGLTGLAQINGRNATTWEERLDYDIEYVETRTFLLDCIIILKTVKKVLKSSGVEGDSDMSIVRLDRDESYNKGKKA